MEAVALKLSTMMFPPLSPPLIPLIALLTLVFLAGLALLEILEKHLEYSKFAETSTRKKYLLSSRSGMLLIYTPALFVGVASFLLFPNDDLRFLLVKSAVTVHFLKRDLEVLFLHKFSGGMVIDSAIIISLGYLTAAAFLIYAQHLIQGMPQPAVDLKYVGLLLFLVGIGGNLYHHYLLASLRRKDGEKGYKVPKGGLFGFVICPHYLFEILDFFGIFMITQTLVGLSAAVGVFFYLSARSYATWKWYVAKFEDFPKNVKALIPFVF